MEIATFTFGCVVFFLHRLVKIVIFVVLGPLYSSHRWTLLMFMLRTLRFLKLPGAREREIVGVAINSFFRGILLGIVIVWAL